MGQDEDAQPLVRRAFSGKTVPRTVSGSLELCRAEQARRRRVAHAPKLSQDGFKAEGDVTGDVFQKDPLRGAFPNDAGDLRPEVAGVIGTTALASGAEGLAGISGEDDVEGTAERAGIETAQIIPDWRGCEVACALGGDEDATGIALPFDKDACVVSGFSEHEAQIQASAACAEGKSVPGT